MKLKLNSYRSSPFKSKDKTEFLKKTIYYTNFFYWY